MDEMQQVIRDVAAPLSESGMKVQTIEHEGELSTTCNSTIRGTSKCLATAIFHSSPSQGSNSIWNYTLRGDADFGKSFFVDLDNNDAQIYTIPFQHAIDAAIARKTSAANSSASSMQVYEYPFSSEDESQRQNKDRARFMDMMKDILVTPFYLVICCIVYQMTGFIATERESGMARLLDSMLPNQKRWQPQLVRVLSNHLAFTLLYCPGWIVTGAILGAMCFPSTNMMIPIMTQFLAGLSTVSFTSLLAVFFRKAQLSGILSIMIALAPAIIAQIVKPGTVMVILLSLLFPPSNYISLIVAMTRWQSQDRPTNLVRTPPNAPFSVSPIIFWLFALLHMIMYPVLTAFAERMLYGTASSSRETVVSPHPVAVHLSGFSKQYTPNFVMTMLKRWTKQQTGSVLAVDSLNLDAYHGEITVLLGANGSGKSTTLDAIAGQHSASSGKITINYHSPEEGFGHCPQKNILWDDLTVQEHVNIFESIKSTGKPASRDEVGSLIAACDLAKKARVISAALSGGQKRKLQMAMMFAGGSTVCCVDEVSSGVDPLSRRKLWDILLAQRGTRSIILTTHFLDEADVLADRIAILSKGRLQATGSSVELKHNLGSGYRVHVPHSLDGHREFVPYRDMLHVDHGHEITYFPGAPKDAYRLLQRLEDDGLQNYEVNGPTLEDVFFKVEEEAFHGLQKEGTNELVSFLELSKGKPVGLSKQMKALLSKKFKILRREPMPYLALLAVVLIAAGCSTIFLQDATSGQCNSEGFEGQVAKITSQAISEYKIVAGPPEQVSAATIEEMAQSSAGSVTLVNTLEEFNAAISQNYSKVSPGGFFLGASPTFVWRADSPPYLAHTAQNLMNNILYNVSISSNYDFLDAPFSADLGPYLLFIILFGLAMAIYPAFLALYPTLERLRGIRIMQYSNGVRALPLWLAYLVFDFAFIVLISFVSIIIFGATVDIWYAIGYILLIMLLYGIAASLYSYVVSLFAASQLAAFAITAGVHVVFFLIYFAIFMVIYTFNEASTQATTMNIVYFTLALFSPIVSLSRALYITLNVFGVSCRDKRLASYPAIIDLYGGPILYLVLQSIVLFAVIIWKESGFSGLKINFRSRRSIDRDSMIEMTTPIRSGAARSTDGLEVVQLRKEFKKHLAVDDVSFSIPHGECFALVGPNGAGKSTSISMIRGDIAPTGANSEIYIDGMSALTQRGAARTRLGVCPQIDPLDHMTVFEHMLFYAQIRGLAQPSEAATTIINAVGLASFTTRIASKLSGGNKRKLTLAISLVGNPSVLLLDEPSSGMDPLSKRIMWRTLSAIAPTRSLLLTTHSMEEADALATRAGIISGRMLASGSIPELKARYGDTYFIHLVHTDAPYTSTDQMDMLQQWAVTVFRHVRFDGRATGGQVRFQVPMNNATGRRSLAEIFGLLEEAREDLGVQYYGVGVATLDQIFSNVVGKYGVARMKTSQRGRRMRVGKGREGLAGGRLCGFLWLDRRI
ncbi:hypothetical protein N0V90_004244 [Kalmusia sp. IMI 367209]|nr:hypothetical protein N0V90_004244 [Kalmusia sp. IMI 367209]